MPDPKPVGPLTPLAPDVKPVGELRPLNQAAKTDKAFQEAAGITATTPKDKKITQVWSDDYKGAKEEPGLLSQLGNSIVQGLDEAYAMLARSPEMLNDMLAQANADVTNMLTHGKFLTPDGQSDFDLAGVKGTENKPYTSKQIKEDIKKSAGETSLMAKLVDAPEKIAKYYEADAELRQKETDETYDKGITDYFAAGEYKKGLGLISNHVARTVPVTLGLIAAHAAGVPVEGQILGGGVVFGAGKRAELDKYAPDMDEETKLHISAYNGLIEGVFEQFGLTKLGGMVRSILSKEGKAAAMEAAQEGFNEVYKPVIKKYLGVAASEGLSEAATQFAQNAIDKYSGYKPDLDLSEGVVDAGIIGIAAGGAFTAIPAVGEIARNRKNKKTVAEEKQAAIDEKAAVQEEKIQKDAARSKHAFEVIEEGDDAIIAFKESVNKQVEAGTLTPEEAAHAITRVNSYKEYNDITNTMDLTPEKKLEVFDKTFQKQQLETQLREMGEKSKLHPLKQAEFTVKEKFANDLQKDIDKILLEAQIPNETTVGEKTLEDLAKAEEKNKPGEKPKKKTPLQKAFEEKYKDRLPKEDTRTYDELTAQEYNDDKLNARTKHRMTAEHLSEQPGKKTMGRLAERPFEWNGKGSTVLGIELPGGKKIRFASSMERIFGEDGGKGMRGHFMQERFDKELPIGTQIGVRVYDLVNEDGETEQHIKAFRPSDGKFIGWMKKTNTGSYKPSTDIKEQLDHLETVDEVDGPTEEVTAPTKPTAPTDPETKALEKELEDLYDKDSALNSPERERLFAQGVPREEVYKRQFDLFSKTKDGKRAAEIERILEERKKPAEKKAESKPVEKKAEAKKEEKKAEKPVEKKNEKTPEKKAIKSIKELGIGDEITDSRGKTGVVVGFEGNRVHAKMEMGGYLTVDPKYVEIFLEKKAKSNTLEPNGTAEKNTTGREKPASGDNNQADPDGGKDVSKKEITLRRGTKKARRKIKDPEMKLALRADAHTPYDITLQHFIQGEQVSHATLREFFSTIGKGGYSKTELNKRIGYWRKDGKTLDQVAHDLWEEHAELNYDTSDWKTAVEDVVRGFESTKVMARDLNARLNKVQDEQFSPGEQELAKAFDNIEVQNDRVIADVENITDALENLTDEQLIELSKKTQSEFDQWEESQDIIKDDGEGPVFQNESAETSENIDKIIEVIKKNFPKVEVVYDKTLDKAGQLDGNTIRINPYYAGNDTPIHEAAHIFLDALETDNPTLFKEAVSQVKDSALWEEIASDPDYKNLSETMLAKEVLAESIGKEGVGIFDEVTKQNKFIQTLNKIFDWFKQKLGLEKNIAKALARQILAGQGTKGLTGKSGQQQQNQNFNKKDFNYFREKELGRDTEKQANNLKAIDDILEEDLEDDERADLEQTKAEILAEIQEDKEAYKEYKKAMKRIDEINMPSTLQGVDLNDLIEAYNDTRFYQSSIDTKALTEIRQKIAVYLSHQGKERLRKHANYVEKNSNTKDLDWLDVWNKVLSHMNQNFPELQEMSKIFDEAYLEMQQERMDKKKQLQKLADAVIKEKNKTLGIREKLTGLVFSNAAKYFDFMDNGSGELVSGQGLTKAQSDFLNYIKELTKERKLMDEDGNLIQNEVLKIDRGTMETFRESGFLEAVSETLGIANTEGQQEILDSLKKGLKEKIFAPFKALALAYKTKKEKGGGEYALNYNGQLTNKFNKQRSKEQGYSKDFYRAAQMYIDDITHVKHMSKMVAIADSVSLLNQRGYGEQLAKPNAVKFLEEWSQEQIYKAQKKTGPILDSFIKFFRHLTSMVIMGFNIPAAGMNVFIGNYNNWRKDARGLDAKGNLQKSVLGLNTGLIANKRFFSKKGIAILKHYAVVDSDFDSNPKAFGGRLFDFLAYGAQRYGEMQIQGSMFLSQLSVAEWNSMSTNKDGDIVFKPGTDEKALRKQMTDYKNRVSDVQGKYSEKDRRNFMRGEFGKALTQFKTWMPDYLKERFGEEYIDRNNVTHKGSFNGFFKQAVADLKEDWSNKNFKKTLANKQMAQNLKGALFIAGLMVLKYSGDDKDKKTKRKILSAENAIGNLLFIFDPEQLAYTIKNPVAIQGTILAFIDVLIDLKKMDSKKLKKDILKVTPYKKVIKPLVEGKIEDAPRKIFTGN